MDKSQELIVFYDGVCKLCNGFVNFLLAVDKKGVIKFASLQSAFAEHLLQDAIKKSEDFETIIFLEKGKIYYESSAVLRIFKYLGFFYSILSIFLIVPSFVRNPIYRLISRHRYKIFGRYQSCKLPDKSYEDRFYDEKL